jgi:hypothetical protein
VAWSAGGGLCDRRRAAAREFLQVRRQGDADRLEQFAGKAGSRRAQPEALAVLLQCDLLQAVEIAQNVAPFGDNAMPVEALFQFPSQYESQEGAEDVAVDRRVTAVVNGARGQNGFDLARQLLNPQQITVAQHRLQGGQPGVGAQYVKPVEAGIPDDALFVDSEVFAAGGL